MLRPNEIYEKSFERVDEGSYSAKDVDAFMKEVASSYEQVFKQNGELVRRLSLLANRLEAYRRQEELAEKQADKDENEEFNESLKAKLDQAKAVAQRMLDEAKNKAVGIVDNANAQSDRILVDLKDKIKEQKVTLDLLNAQSDAFKKKLLDTYREHLILIDSIPVEAEKIVKAAKSETKEEADGVKEEFKVDTDATYIFSEADEFVEKLDEPVETVTENNDDVSFDSDVDSNGDSFEPVEEIKDVSADESGEIFSDAEEDDVVSSVPDEKAIVEEEADVEDEADAEVKDEGFSFDFSNISFDDEEDEEIFDEDEEDKPLFEVKIEQEGETERLFDSSKEENDNIIADVFTSDEEVAKEDVFDSVEAAEEETETHQENADRPSLKDLIRAKGSIDETDIEIVESDDEESFDVKFDDDEDTLEENDINNHFRIDN